ncbi:MAG: hypothetical protein RIB67_09575 [Miltoncostaeaceae bacterium]
MTIPSLTRDVPGARRVAMGAAAVLLGFGAAVAAGQDPSGAPGSSVVAPVEPPPGPPRLGRLIIAPRTSGFLTLGGRRGDITFGGIVDRPVLLRLQVQRNLPGRMRGGACLAPARALVRAGARPCRRRVTLGVARRRAEGEFVIVLDGARVGRRVLGPGVYRVRLTARAGRDVSGGRTGAFRILPPGR